MDNTKNIPNRLIHEKSPYLLQHAYNPVQWFPWGEEAFEKARQENKPVFLSIGYSTCHWCHVMEQESFENEEIAELLNREYICVKVDREERPDVDAVYMSVCQAMNGQGGWPLTILMAPDGKPFFSGTYFPPHARYGSPGLEELLTAAAGQWRRRKKASGKRGADSGVFKRTGTDRNRLRRGWIRFSGPSASLRTALTRKTEGSAAHRNFPRPTTSYS